MALRKIVTGSGVKKYQINVRDADGIQVKREFSTLTEAKQKHAEIEPAKARGTYIAPSRLPRFGEIAERWINGKATHRPSRRSQWRTHLAHLAPIDPVRLDRIDVAWVERFRDDLRQKKPKPLGPRTINKVLTTGAAIFDLAQRHGLVERNPFRLAERLRVGAGELVGDERTGRFADGRVRPEDVPTVDEVRKLIAEADEGLHRALFFTQALTGVRTGELFALQWPDLDWTKELIAIRRSVSWARVESDGEPVRFRFFPPKTAAGIRDLPFPNELQRMLKVWKLKLPAKPEQSRVPGRQRHTTTSQ